MASNVKLTKVQMKLLVDLERSGAVGTKVVQYYKPDKKLVALGMAIWRHTTLGSTYLCITPTGLEVLSELGGPNA